METVETLWQESSSTAQACLLHPFVQGIGEGSLARACFAGFVGQDAFFLESFMRAYCIAAAKAPNWETSQIFHALAGGVLNELKLHRKYAAEWDMNLEHVKPSAVTRRYTDFLMATAWREDVGVTVAAMLPCMKLYAYLGGELALKGIPNHAYSDWIRTYSSDVFRSLVTQLENLAKQLATDSAKVRDVYFYAMQCEYDFFEAVWAEGS